MKKLLLALLLLAGSTAHAGIYKCENKATGEIEFKDMPCTNEQTAQAVPRSVSKVTGDYSEAETRALAEIVNGDREAFRAVCEEQLDGLDLSETMYQQRCETALAKQAECKVAASRMFPKKVHSAYMRAMANGMSEEEASKMAQARENWEGISTEEATEMVAPIADFTRDCIRGVFR